MRKAKAACLSDFKDERRKNIFKSLCSYEKFLLQKELKGDRMYKREFGFEILGV